MARKYEIPKESFNVSEIKEFLLVVDVEREDTYLEVIGAQPNNVYKRILKEHVKTKDVKDLPQMINDILEEAHKVFNIEISITIISGDGSLTKDRDQIKIYEHELEIKKEDLKKKTLIQKYVFLDASEARGADIQFLTKKELKEINNASDDSKIKNTALLKVGHGIITSINKYDHDKKTQTPMISKAGNMNFPTETYFDLELANHAREQLLEGKQGPISTELIVSEKGICLIYDFLLSKKIYGEPIIKIKETDPQKKAEKILETKEDTYCVRTTDLFIIYLARTARELATATMPYGGLYLEGRLIKKIENTIKKPFMKEFLNTEIKETLKQIPIHVIEKENPPLKGACSVFMNQKKEF